MFKRSTGMVMLACLILFGVVGCNLGGGGGSGSSSPSDTTFETPTVSPEPSPTSSITVTPLHITGIVMTVSPSSLSSIACGNTADFVYSATIAVADGGAGGPVSYTWKIGGTIIPGTVTFAPGQTTKNVTYTLSHTAIQLGGSAVVMGMLSANYSGAVVTSAPTTPSGSCTLPGPFTVVGINISVNPSSVTTIPCNSNITVVYSATITIGADSNGGTVALVWTILHATSATSITFGPSLNSQSQTVTYSLPGKVVIGDHNGFPPYIYITSTSPNVVKSAVVKSTGFCV